MSTARPGKMGNFWPYFMPFTALVFIVLVMSLFTTTSDASLSETWENLKNSDAVQQAQKEWSRGQAKAQTFVNKATNGKLAEDITTYIDNTLMKLFSIRVSELQKTLKRAQQTWLGPALLALWILLGVVTFKLTSLTSCLVVMATTLLVHSIYGPVVVFTQVVIFIGLCMYFISLIANNLVLTAITIVTIYVASFVFGLCHRAYSQGSLDDLDDKVAFLGERTAHMESKMEDIDNKLDLLLQGQD